MTVSSNPDKRLNKQPNRAVLMYIVEVGEVT